MRKTCAIDMNCCRSVSTLAIIHDIIPRSEVPPNFSVLYLPMLGGMHGGEIWYNISLEIIQLQLGTHF